MSMYPPDPWVIIGKIGKSVGLNGNVRVWPECDLGQIFEDGIETGVFLSREKTVAPLRMTEAWEDAHGWVVKWEGYDSREASNPIRNAFVVARREDLPEPMENEVYWADLMGAKVVSRQGEPLGVVTDFIDTAANGVCEIQREDGRKFLIPLTEEVDARLTNTEPRALEVNFLEGLFEATEITREPRGLPDA